jgi:predicted ATPase
VADADVTRTTAQDQELLEREHELRALDALIVAACRGSGQLVRVEGAAGVGKTRLLATARNHAQRAGMRVLVSRNSTAFTWHYCRRVS